MDKTLARIRAEVAATVGVGDRGVCGWQAAAFHKRASKAGYECRIVGYRGHVCNQVKVRDNWETWDVHIPENPTQKLLMEHVLASPPVFYTSDADFMRSHEVTYLSPTFGEYHRWLGRLVVAANILVPWEIKSGYPLSSTKPNVVLRHDMDGDPANWLWMAYEDIVSGVRSVTYVLPHQLQVARELWEQYHFIPLSFGLHFDTTNLTELKKQTDMFSKTFPREPVTLAAHGHKDPDGGHPALAYFPYPHDYEHLPEQSSFLVEKSQPNGFINILEATGAYSGCLVDNWGIIYPEDPKTFIAKMRPGCLYYLLFHPMNFSLENGLGSSLKFNGIITGKTDLNSAMKHVATDASPYMRNPDQRHIHLTVDYLKKHLRPKDTIVDLLCGVGLLNIYLAQEGCRNYRYIGVDYDYLNIRGCNKLHVALNLKIPVIHKHDLRLGGLQLNGDYVIMLSWESDYKDGRMFDHIHDYVPVGNRLIVSWLPDSMRSTEWWRPQYYTIPDVSFFEKMGFVEEGRIENVYGGVYGNISILKRVV